MSSWKYKTTGISDDEFIRGEIPMTKSEVRAVTLSKLKLKDGLNVLDIGAGTGSVSVECALQGCSVTAIERNPKGIELIKKNVEKFDLDSVDIIEGYAPNDLPNISFDRVFIGGSRGKLEGLFKYLDVNLTNDGVLVANTITIENTYQILTLLDKYGYKNIGVIAMNISRSNKVGSVHMMKAENPITIISAIKGS